MRIRQSARGRHVIDPRRTQLNFGDGLIADEVVGLHEEWMIHADRVLADDQILAAAYEELCPSAAA
jgi:transposase, IS5 family